MKIRIGLILAALVIGFNVSFAQDETQPKRFDFGKMWTFENPPKEWFAEAYGFNAEDAWFDDVRKSALRFASWCSASFVSPDGLIMTNHHCSRGVVHELELEGESFEDNGFYAETLGDERKAEGLFVEQLLMVADVTERVHSAAQGETDAQRASEKRDSVLAMIQAEYSEMDNWKDLRLQVVTYYSGGKYSLYGYKKYDDIRLVMIPEGQLGYFGGDPDNFTFPRYNLDCTFWRAYENGKPVNTSGNYFKFNVEGAKEGEPVFVIGNPGRTERYRTVSQLEYDRDYRFPIRLEMLNNRHKLLSMDYENDPENDELMNQIFGISNSLKAFTGIQGGLEDADLMARKKNMEDEIRAKTTDESPWVNLEAEYKKLYPHAAAITLLGPSPIKGNALQLMFSAHAYEQALTSGEASEEDLNKMREEINQLSTDLKTEREYKYLKTLYKEIVKFSHPDNNFMDKVLQGKSPKEVAKATLNNTWFADDEKREKLLGLKAKKFAKCDDPILEAARVFVPAYGEAVNAFRGSTADRRSYEEQVANAVFKVKGTDLPPDATFTLRIADGVVKGYDYNGTTAPYKTTYYGLYDRYYSNDKEFPWSLPSAWMNPDPRLLSSPFNFVSTNDIIGGNSGSAIVNRNKEAVGLIFDGNIESLPGNFIFDEEYNRSVSVHAGGIVAALKYVYNAERIVKELTGE